MRTLLENLAFIAGKMPVFRFKNILEIKTFEFFFKIAAETLDK